MGFRIRGKDYEIDRGKLIEAIKDVAPNPTDERHKFYVEINGRRYPIKQPIHLVTGLPYIAFTAQDAYRILTKLDFEVHPLRESNTMKPEEQVEPALVRPIGALALVGAWRDIEDSYLDALITDIYSRREKDTGRYVELEG